MEENPLFIWGVGFGFSEQILMRLLFRSMNRNVMDRNRCEQTSKFEGVYQFGFFLQIKNAIREF